MRGIAGSASVPAASARNRRRANVMTTSPSSGLVGNLALRQRGDEQPAVTNGRRHGRTDGDRRTLLVYCRDGELHRGQNAMMTTRFARALAAMTLLLSMALPGRAQQALDKVSFGTN